MKHIMFVESNVLGLKALLRAKELGHRVSFVYSDLFKHYYENTPDFRNLAGAIDHMVKIDNIFNESVLIEAMKECVRTCPVNAAICLLEPAIIPAARAAERLGILFTRSQGIRTARNKGLVREKLAENGLRTAKAGYGNSIDRLVALAETIGYPVIMKPNSGAGSWFVKKINSSAELRLEYDNYIAYLDRVPAHQRHVINDHVVVEEYVNGQMLSLEIGAMNGHYFPFGICQRDRYKKDETLELGSTMPMDLSGKQHEAIVTYGINVLQAIGLDRGIFHVEMLLTDNGPVLIEANPRLMGGTGPRLLNISFGWDIFKYLIDIHLDNPFEFAARLPVYYTTSRFLASETGFHYQNPMDESWLGQYKNNLVEFHIMAMPGTKIPKASSYEDYFGYFLVRADSFDASKSMADAILGQVERCLDTPLLKR